MSFGLTFLGDIIVGSVCFIAGMALKDKVNAMIAATVTKMKAAGAASLAVFKTKKP